MEREPGRAAGAGSGAVPGAVTGAVTGAVPGAVAGAVAVLVAANVLNNRLAPRLAPLTSAAATGALVVMARRSGLSWAELGFHRRSRGLRIGGALASAVAGAYAAGIAVPATRRFFRDERALSLSRARALEEALLQVPVGTVLLEEVGFRGVLHALVARSHGHGTATAVSSVLFGLWHILPAVDMMAANPALSRLAAGEAPDAPAARDPRDSRDPRTEGTGTAGVSDTPTGPGAPDVPSAPEKAPEKVPERAPGRVPAWQVARVVAGSVVTTGLAGVLFTELRRRGGLTAPAMFHVATNSLGYLFARLAPPEEPSPGRGPLPK
ncbi:CPBP family intramembrane metalloprotease [Streptosporangium sp. NBC_01495]|uniref:CPBP family intramembrane glutamic endopeptidase n=1 Tax=Streptosporangium sp. NBC_01495 TaxID=2903899 RepID=UPI002E3185C5|nr:CPBP family intramembrane glutamic endopeptidase [Streptosporangium sp. NBC_01495]